MINIYLYLKEGNAHTRASIIINSANKELSKSSINVIAIAAINILPQEKAINFLRNLIKDEIVTQIEENNYEIEVIVMQFLDMLSFIFLISILFHRTNQY